MQVQSNTQTSQPNLSSNTPSPVSATATPSAKPKLVPPPALSHIKETPISTDQVSVGEKDSKVKLGKNKRVGSKKQIPTILGLLILFVALISGVLLFGQGTGIFAPRATAETTPKSIRVTNVTDKTFTISFYTDESTVAFVKYGEDENSLTKQASDDRDQLSGVVKDYHLHHVTVRSLEPGKNYFYVLGTGSSSFDNEGKPYSLVTASKPNQSPTNNQTVYGNVLNPDTSPAEGAIVYLYSEGMGTLSSLVKSSGSWGISLANAFNVEKSSYATLTDESAISIKFQGTELDLVGGLETTVALAAPIADLTLAKIGSTASASATGTENLQTVDKEELLAGAETSSSTDLVDDSISSDSTAIEETTASAGALQDLLVADDSTPSTVLPVESEVLNLGNLDETQEASATTITTTQPQIKATLPANTMVRVVIHSETTIDETVQTDANGNMVLDVASLGQNLEPGEHTASYTYIDPVTGQEVTKTYNFTVAPTASRQLAAAADLGMTGQRNPTATPTIPYGSGNPYSPTIPAKPTLAATPTATPSTASSKSATVSTTSGQYNSGSVGTTFALLLGGLFFILAGVWSYFLATSFEQKRVND